MTAAAGRHDCWPDTMPLAICASADVCHTKAEGTARQQRTSAASLSTSVMMMARLGPLAPFCPLPLAAICEPHAPHACQRAGPLQCMQASRHQPEVSRSCFIRPQQPTSFRTLSTVLTAAGSLALCRPEMRCRSMFR